MFCEKKENNNFARFCADVVMCEVVKLWTYDLIMQYTSTNDEKKSVLYKIFILDPNVLNN